MARRRTSLIIRQRLRERWDAVTADIPGAKQSFYFRLVKSIVRFDSIFVDPPQELRDILKKMSLNFNEGVALTLDLNRRFPDVGTVVRAREFIETLAPFRDCIVDIELPRGGIPAQMMNKAKKRRTASFIHSYLRQFPDLKPPSGYRSGPYVRQSNILWEVATGKSENLYPECCEVLKREEKKRQRLELLLSRRQG
jgi:hypothetical protein